MKCFLLLLFSIFCHTTFAKAVENKCDIEKFTKCISSLDASSAEDQCKTNGDCSNELMKSIDNCLYEIYTQGTDISMDTLYKYSIACEQQKNKWCYDTYKSALVDGVLSEQYKCGECGEVANKKFEKVVQNMKNNNVEGYEEFQSQVQAMENCDTTKTDICEPSKFSGCFSALRNGKAEIQCKKNGKCSEEVITKLDSCFDYIYSISSTNSTKKINLKVFNNFFKNFNSTFTFSCESADGVWCYDDFNESLKNKTKMKEFKDSKCGKVVIESLDSIVQSIDDKNSPLFIEAKSNLEYIMNVDSGAFTNYPLNFSYNFSYIYLILNTVYDMK